MRDEGGGEGRSLDLLLRLDSRVPVTYIGGTGDVRGNREITVCTDLTIGKGRSLRVNTCKCYLFVSPICIFYLLFICNVHC